MVRPPQSEVGFNENPECGLLLPSLFAVVRLSTERCLEFRLLSGPCAGLRRGPIPLVANDRRDYSRLPQV